MKNNDLGLNLLLKRDKYYFKKNKNVNRFFIPIIFVKIFDIFV